MPRRRTPKGDSGEQQPDAVLTRIPDPRTGEVKAFLKVGDKVEEVPFELYDEDQLPAAKRDGRLNPGGLFIPINPPPGSDLTPDGRLVYSSGSSSSVRAGPNDKKVKGERICGHCSKLGAGLKLCSRCRQEWFCGAECIKKAWPVHKDFCKAAPKALQRD